MGTAVVAVPALVAGSPTAFEIYRRFCANPRATARVLIRGVGGTGRSALLGAFRNVLRSAGITATDSVTRFDRATHSALLVDDAHLLDDGELQQLTELAHRDDMLLVVTSRQDYDNVALARLLTLLESVGTAVDLALLDEQGIAAAARAQFGTPVSPKLAGAVFDLTGGLSYLVDAGLRAADPRVSGSTPGGAAQVAGAVRRSVASRLRRIGPHVPHVIALESIGAELHDVELAELLEIDLPAARAAIAETATCGLTHRSGDLGSIIADELSKLVSRYQRETVGRRLLDMRIRHGNLSPRFAANLANWGVRDRRLRELLLDEAESQAGFDRAAADELYHAAIATGAVSPESSIRQAEVAFALGHLDEALAITDASWEHAGGASLLSAARVAASAWSARGMVSRGADVYSWVRPDRVGEDGPVAATLLACAGDRDAAGEMMSVVDTRPPTSDASGNRLLAEALLSSLENPGAATLNLFVRSLAVFGTSGASGVRPDSPAAITAIAALHAGDLRRARKVMNRALQTEIASSPTLHARHRLLLGWIAMLEGNLNGAACGLSNIAGAAQLPLRERFLADALRVAIARRRADTGQLYTSLAQARESIDEFSVDLLSLLPVGELWSAASKVGKTSDVQGLVDEAFALLRRLGEPPFWSSALHWHGVAAAIQSDSPVDLTTHAHALGMAAAQSGYAAALASAGRTWVQILGAEVDVAEISRAAAGLQAIGLGWDGANLAGKAALRCADGQLSAELLQIARNVGQPVSAVEVAAAASPTDRDVLSERQREVAALLVTGLTYRGVGERLFISPKTVEYHVAEIKRRIGTDSRSELLSRLHALELSTAS